jgi:hypothetical protein
LQLHQESNYFSSCTLRCSGYFWRSIWVLSRFFIQSYRQYLICSSKCSSAHQKYSIFRVSLRSYLQLLAPHKLPSFQVDFPLTSMSLIYTWCGPKFIEYTWLLVWWFHKNWRKVFQFYYFISIPLPNSPILHPWSSYCLVLAWWYYSSNFSVSFPRIHSRGP